MGRFFKICTNLKWNWLKFKKILEKSGDFDQNLAQNWTSWYMNGSLFLEKLVFVWVYFQILWRHIPTKTKLEYSRALQLQYDSVREIDSHTHGWYKNHCENGFRNFRQICSPAVWVWTRGSLPISCLKTTFLICIYTTKCI